MNPERWQRIEELFRTVIDRPAAERDNYLTRVCDGDEELRREVLSLLALDTSEDFIRDPIANAALSLSAKPKDDLTGERIGPYRVVRLIGRGGMGDVYEAERDDDQFRQQVAIKIIKRGMDTDFVRDRFLRERQILASLDHPHIARLIDGGATEDGRPYFVMEFVDGEPITDYCRRRELNARREAETFPRRLLSRTARPPEAGRPPRPQAEQHHGYGGRRRRSCSISASPSCSRPTRARPSRALKRPCA